MIFYHKVQICKILHNSLWGSHSTVLQIQYTTQVYKSTPKLLNLLAYSISWFLLQYVTLIWSLSLHYYKLSRSLKSGNNVQTEKCYIIYIFHLRDYIIVYQYFSVPVLLLIPLKFLENHMCNNNKPISPWLQCILLFFENRIYIWYFSIDKHYVQSSI